MASEQYGEKTDLHRWTSDLHMLYTCIQNKSDAALTSSDLSSSVIVGLAEWFTRAIVALRRLGQGDC